MITSIVVLVLAIFLRGVLSVRSSKIKHGEDFHFKYYFDLKHCFRWIVHIVSSAIGYFILPNVFALIRYWYPTSEDYMVIGAFAVGFAGYDFIKILENACLWLADKWNIPLRKWVSSDPSDEDLAIAALKKEGIVVKNKEDEK
jgi:hypothetical protein